MATDKQDFLELTTSLFIKAQAKAVWDELMVPEKASVYFWGVKIESDFKVGSPITWSGEWEGKPFSDKGVIQKIEPPHYFEYLYWSPFYGTTDEKSNYKKITYRFAEQNDGTLVTITQDKVESAEALAKSEANWQTMLAAIKAKLD